MVSYGVVVDDVNIELQFQLSEIAPEDRDGIHEIVDELETLDRPNVKVAVTRRRVSRPSISPHDGVAWVFVARA